jgi:hypothetical protein
LHAITKCGAAEREIDPCQPAPLHVH